MYKRLSNKISTFSPAKQFLLVRLIYDIALFVFDAYYMTYIFKFSQTIEAVIYNILITFITIIIGFILGIFIIPRSSINNLIRLSFLTYFSTGVIGIFIVDKKVEIFFIISALRGLAEGLYWSAINVIELSGVQADSRSKYYSVSAAINSISAIIIPIVLGYILTSEDNFQPIFIIFSLLSIIGIVLPYHFNHLRYTHLSLTKLKQLIKLKRFPRFLLIKNTSAMSWTLEWLMWSIVPFIIFGDELNMGIYLSVSAIIGGIIALLTHKKNIISKSAIAIRGIALNAISAIFFVFNFNYIGIYVNQLINNITNGVVTPVEFDLNVRCANKLQPDNDFSLEILVLQELIYTLARIIICVSILVISQFVSDITIFMQVILILIVTSKIIIYKLSINYIHNDNK